MIAASRIPPPRRPVRGRRVPLGRDDGCLCACAADRDAEDSRQGSIAEDLRNARRRPDRRLERRWRLDPPRSRCRRVPRGEGILRRRIRCEGVSCRFHLGENDAPPGGGAGRLRGARGVRVERNTGKSRFSSASRPAPGCRSWPRLIRGRRPHLPASSPSAFRHGPSSAGGGATMSST